MTNVLMQVNGLVSSMANKVRLNQLMRQTHLLISVLFLSLNSINGQDADKVKKYQLNGYIKELASINVINGSTTFDNLIHNRLNLKWYTASTLTVTIEMRNRIFSGNLVKEVPDYDKFVDANNDYFDLSIQGPEDGSWLFQSMIDRAYIEWYKDNWELRAGRQRINWGVNLVWNPNDLFNAYSFFDFDYEERPGSDAIRIKKYTGFASSFEIASSVSDEFDDMVMAVMWKFNKGGYDFQLLGGKARQDVAAGAGWAGNLGDAGLKGEVTWFIPYTNKESLNETLLASITVDYSFENSLYVNGSILYNSDGSDDLLLNGLTFGNTGQLTARDLSPFEYSTFLQVSFTFHPLITGGLATIYYPGQRNALFLNPNATFSIKPNLDLDLIGQLYYDKPTNGDYQALARLVYARIKWSF